MLHPEERHSSFWPSMDAVDIWECEERGGGVEEKGGDGKD